MVISKSAGFMCSWASNSSSINSISIVKKIWSIGWACSARFQLLLFKRSPNRISLSSKLLWYCCRSWCADHVEL
jgi:hypothetical protein